MQGAWTRRSSKYAMGAALLLALTGRVAAGGDDSGSGLLGRLFRFGGGSSSRRRRRPRRPQQPAPLPYGGIVRQLPAAGRVIGRAGDCPLASSFGGLPETPPAPGRRRAVAATDPQVAGQHRGDHGRPGPDAIRPGAVERRQQLRHVPPDLRRRDRGRLRGRPPHPAGRPEADHGRGPVGRAVPAPRALRGPVHGLHRIRPCRRLRAAIRAAPGPFVLLLGQSAGLRPRRSGTCTRRSRTSRRS